MRLGLLLSPVVPSDIAGWLIRMVLLVRTRLIHFHELSIYSSDGLGFHAKALARLFDIGHEPPLSDKSWDIGQMRSSLNDRKLVHDIGDFVAGLRILPEALLHLA